MRVVALVAALHVTVLSLFFGPWHIGYLVSATLSATLIWGAVFLFNESKCKVGLVTGVLLGIAVQQAAYHLWKGELHGFWWPLAQFGALQFLVGYGLGKAEAGGQHPGLRQGKEELSGNKR